jgi:hypothetical protein
MNKILCIYPKDTTTEFLRPVYNAICAKPNVVGLELDTIEDDDFLEKLSNHLADVGVVFFLGHGSSTCLYGTDLNPLIEDKMGNIEGLRNKSLILFACKSSEFIRNYHFQDSLGFGFIPTSLDDARDGVLHSVNLRKIDSFCLGMFRKAIVRIWHRTLTDVSLEQLATISNVFSFYTNCEIVDTLLHSKESQDYRILADMLYYLKEDMKYYAS